MEVENLGDRISIIYKQSSELPPSGNIETGFFLNIYQHGIIFDRKESLVNLVPIDASVIAN